MLRVKSGRWRALAARGCVTLERTRRSKYTRTHTPSLDCRWAMSKKISSKAGNMLEANWRYSEKILLLDGALTLQELTSMADSLTASEYSAQVPRKIRHCSGVVGVIHWGYLSDYLTRRLSVIDRYNDHQRSYRSFQSLFWLCKYLAGDKPQRLPHLCRVVQICQQPGLTPIHLRLQAFFWYALIWRVHRTKFLAAEMWDFKMPDIIRYHFRFSSN